MNQIGLCSVTFRDLAPEEVVDVVRTTPLEYIEWAGDVHVPVELEVGLAREIAALYSVSSYGSYYHAGEGEDFEAVLAQAKNLGATDIRIWAGNMDMDKPWGQGDADVFDRIVADIKAVAKLASADGIKLNIEHHQWTYADSTEETVKLLEAIDEPNVYLNWQPPMEGSVADKVADIRALGPWISNVHVFNWDSKFQRYPLVNGKDAWAEYIAELEKFPFEGRKYLLEFVLDDDVEQLKRDADTLAELMQG